MIQRNFGLTTGVFYAFALAVLVAAPFLAFGGGKTIYVDDDAKGKQDGSSEHPYDSIETALSKAKNGTTVRVRKGEYDENVTVPSNVKLVGDDREKVIIDGDNDQATVKLNDNTELSTLTITDGRHGISVNNDSKTHIFNVTVKSSEKDGIHIEKGSTDKKDRALLDDVWVKDSGRAGLYAQKRDLVITDSTFEKNDTDGIALAAGVKASIDDTRLHDNKGAGLSLILDGSNVWTKDNSIRWNKKSGIEINSYGAGGNFGVKQGSIVGNGHYALAKVARSGAAVKNFGNVVYDSRGGNKIYTDKNGRGILSPILRLF